MFGKIKKVFFNGVFLTLYISFLAQLVYVLGWSRNIEQMFLGLGLLALEWLVLIAARYLSKKSSGGNTQGGGNFNRHRR